MVLNGLERQCILCWGVVAVARVAACTLWRASSVHSWRCAVCLGTF